MYRIIELFKRKVKGAQFPNTTKTNKNQLRSHR